MDRVWHLVVWQQFGAAIDMLEDAIEACPPGSWSGRARPPEFWYLAFHTLFWLDYYLSESAEGFAPPAPYTLDEFDPAGIVPERPYSKAQLLEYLAHGREKCRRRIVALTDAEAGRLIRFGRQELSVAEWLLYNLRHVQHHAAQLHLLLRQGIDATPGWVSRSRHPLEPA